MVVSDLHMATPDGPIPDPFCDDASFAGLLASLRSDGVRTRLILLGDILDLVLAAARWRTRRGTGPMVAARHGLDAIAAAHPCVFAALGAYSRAGHAIDVVPGNHDIGLLHRPLQQRLRELIAGGNGGRPVESGIRFWPWIVHVPGVLYAEHGHVFGHTYVARDRPLWARAGAPRYLNAGTWSSVVRQGRDRDRDRLRFVEIEHGGDRPPIARLQVWDGDRMVAQLAAT